MTKRGIPADLKVLYNYIYEYQKGIRPLVLYTISKDYEAFATERLQHQGIPYFLQDVSKQSTNIYFGNKECLQAIELIITKPLNLLTPEEDFMLGALLGYDLRMQCERYCSRKGKTLCMNCAV